MTATTSIQQQFVVRDTTSDKLFMSALDGEQFIPLSSHDAGRAKKFASEKEAGELCDSLNDRGFAFEVMTLAEYLAD